MVVWQRVDRRWPNSLILALSFFIAGCSNLGDKYVAQTKVPSLVLVSLADQRIGIVTDGVLAQSYMISSASRGNGESPGSNRTPRGWHIVHGKIGADLPIGAVLVGRQPTGEILPALDIPGRHDVVTRILTIDGVEPFNRTTLQRLIYIHGTANESSLSVPDSGGCIRMASQDIVGLFHTIQVGTPVYISESTQKVAVEMAIGDWHRLSWSAPISRH